MMADKTDSENGKTTHTALDKSHPVVRAVVASDGTVTIPHSEATLTSVDVADVDLLLNFSDGTFVIVPNGALNAISGTPSTVIFDDNTEDLGTIFKMVGISNLAQGGSLRVVSGNVDAPKPVEAADEPQPPDKDFWTPDEVWLSDTVLAPAPLVQAGNPSALGAKIAASAQFAGIADPVLPPAAPRVTSYSDPPDQPNQSTQLTAPTITLSPDITANDIINIAESHSDIAITGTVGGSAKAGDIVTLTVNGAVVTGLVAADKSFSITVAGSDLVADSNHTISASVTSSAGTATDTESYSVDVTAPVVTADQSFSYAENQAAGAVVATVAASDDVGVTGYRFSATQTNTSADGFFTIGGNGQISITAAGAAAGVAQNDFEATPNSFSYGVEAIDTVGNVSASQNITLTITNVDEAAPVVTAGQAFTYAENQTAGAVVGIVAASDDGGITGYRFSATQTDTSADGFFTISATGQISITAAGAAAGVAQNDFETGLNSFSYAVEAIDTVGNVSASQDITLTITNMDEAAPVVTAGQAFSYAENQAVGAVVGIVAASDDIGVTGYRFSATHGSTSADGFYTISATGQISLTAAGAAAGVAQNDFETAPNSFSYGIEAIDAAGHVSVPQNVTFSISNVDDEAPVITAGQTFSYAENQTAGAVVAAVSASDDVGVTGYHFSATHSDTSADGFFTISATGQISITAAGISVAQNDFETTPNSFSYGIEAIDAAGHVSTPQDITLSVTNLDEAAPVVTAGLSFNYAENQVAGAVIAAVSASDDVGVTGYRFSATHSATSADGFYTISGNGQISITAAGVAAGVAQNDFESAPNSFSYGVEAIDAAGHVSNTQDIAFNVTNVDETAPVVTSGQAFSYAENQSAGAVVGIVAASDDVGVTGYRFSATHSATSADGFFAISATGQISLTAAGAAAGVAQNDFETAPNSFSYGIEAIDAVGHVSVPQDVTFSVTNVDDVAPVVTAGLAFSYAENQSAGAVVGIVAASDDVGVAGYHFSATHSATSADGFYTISATGQISTTAAGVAAGVAQNDFETAPNSFSYGVEAIDAAGHVSASQNVIFSVTNVDEAAPVVTAGLSFNYAENQTAGAVVAAVSASDDIGVSGYRFSATHSDTSADGFFTIGASGQISITAAGAAAGVAQNDFETAPNGFSYDIEAIDAAGHVSTPQAITLNVTNMDEAAPVVVAGQTFSYTEHQLAGAVVATVAASDDIGVTGYRFSATQTSTSADGFYTIGATGQISISATGVIETAPNSFIYGIEATDAAGNVSTAENITLTITNQATIDIAAPVITSGQTYSYAENQAAGAVVATVAASDDVGVTGYRFSATLDTTSADGFFTIGANGQISITAAGAAAGVAQNDFETAPNSFSYSIEAFDAAGHVSAPQDITLSVTNVDEAVPMVTAGLSFNYAENQAAGSVIAIVSASDDIGVTGYRFSATHSATSADGFYTISATGQISITAAGAAAGVAQNDFETAPNSFSYGIEAIDAAGNVSVPQDITFTVTNVDETVPVVTAGQSFSYAENQTAGAVIAMVSASDDIGVTGYQFSATHSATSADGFYTISATGQVSITAAGAAAGVAQNDFETAPNSFSYGIEAIDAAGHVSSPQDITLSVTNVDDGAPVVTAGQTFSYAENQVAGTVIAIVAASDDIGVVGYRFSATHSATSADGFYTISATGQVSITAAGAAAGVAQNDFETAPNSFSYGIEAIDAAGHVSTPQDILLSVTNVDEATPPPVITGIMDDSDPVQGNVASGGYTNDTTPTLSGTAGANETVSLYDGIALIATISADASGNWSYTPAPLNDGSNHSFSATATSIAGIVSDASASYVVHIDTTATTPAITGAYDNVGLIQGNVVNGGASNDTTPTLAGIAEANSSVSIYDGGTLVSVVTADGGGSWNYTPAPLGDGSSHGYTIIATDAAGNVSAPSPAYSISIDTTPPSVPAITGVYDDVDLFQGNVANGGTTNDRSPVLSGTAEANSTVSLYDGATLVAMVKAGADGAWSYTPAPLGDGSSHSYTVTATDAVGNVSAASTVYLLHVDSTPPATPVIGGVYDDVDPVTGIVANGGYSNDTTPVLSGTAEANSSVSLYDGANLIATVTADGSGTWNYTPATPLGDGSSHSYAVIATDNAGNVSAASASYTLHIDTTLPAVPVITGAYDDVEPALGNVANGGTTNDTTPTLSGTAEANSTVSLYDGATLVGTVTADGSGHWSYTTGLLVMGSTHSYTVTATDAAGNTSGESASYSLFINNIPPAPVITEVYDNVNPVQGIIVSGGTTNDTTPAISGTAEVNSTVRIYDGAILIATVAADGSGNWSYTSAPLNDGSNHSYTATATNALGSTGPASGAYDVHIDTSAPFVPVITGATDNVSPVLGTVANGGYTNDTTPTLSGTAEANSTVKLYDNAVLVATVTADGSGGWSYTAAALGNGSSHSFTATATDAAGNVSAASAAYVLLIDTTAPSIPSITGVSDNAGPVLGAVANGGYTNDTTPTLSGTAEANSTVKLYDGTTLVATVTADGSGNWSYTLTLNDGSSHSFTATATDAAGNVSAASGAYDVHIDTSAPFVPVITGATDNVSPVLGTVANGGYTNDTTPTLSGTAEANSTVKLYDNAVLVATVTADGSGGWSYTAAALGNGSSHSFTATATDAAGNVSAASAAYVLLIDTTAPSIPSITGVSDNAGPVLGAVANGGYTNDTTPTLSGTAEANSTVKLYDGTTLVATVTTNASGNWLGDTSPLSDGLHNITVVAIDAAGNTSSASAVYTLNIDTAPPPVPVITGAIDNSSPVQGLITNGGTTNDRTLVLSGTAEANSIVNLYEGVNLLFTVTAASNGSWSYVLPTLIDGSSHVYTATATDAAGNTSTSDTYTVHIDATPPSAPVITGAYDNVDLIVGNIASSGYTNDTTPTLSGTAEANCIVRIYNGTAIVKTISADADGNWSYTVGPYSNGTTNSFTAVAIDAAGNVSTASSAYVLSFDTVAPGTPTITGATDNVDPVQGNVVNGGTTNDTTPTLSGTAAVNSIVSLYDGGILVMTQTTTNGSWSFTTGPLATGTTHSYTVTASDAAGNTSAFSASYVLHIENPPPAIPVITGASDNVDPVQGTIANGGYTNDTTPLLSGTAEANSTVSLYDGITLVATIIANGSGNWNYTPTVALSDGSIHSYTATATNAAGIVSAATAAYTLHVDTTIPNAPVVALGTDSNSNTTGTLVISGVDSGSLVEFSSNGLDWSATAPAIVAGSHTVYVHQTDQAGNVSPVTRFDFSYGSVFDDTLTGDAGNNVLIGAAGNDTLNGMSGADTLYGDDGTDILIGGAGADILYGGSGNDTADYSGSLSPVAASLTTGQGSLGDALGDVFYGIENLIGSVAGHDILIGDGNANILTGGAGGGNILEGMAGADVLNGGSGTGNTASYEHAAAGILASLADPLANTGVDAMGDVYSNIQNLTGSVHNDTLIGDSHDNILMGGAGADALYGGAGFDTASYANAHGAVIAALTNSLMPFQSGDAAGDSFNGIENLTGSDYNDALYGDSSGNTLVGGLGNDVLDGFGGDDNMYGGSGHDTITANQGHDSAYGDDSNDTFYVSSLTADLPTIIDGGARDAGLVQDHGGNVMVLQDLVNGGSYDMNALAAHTTNIDTLNIKGDSAATDILISSLDVQHFVNNTTAPELYITADNGDTLHLSADALAAGETMTPAVVDATHTNYTIYNASHVQVAEIHWNHG